MVIITINGKKIGDDYSCYTIAEAGANHESNLNKAFKLIDAAVEGNADSIKFQTYTAAKLTTKTAPKFWDFGDMKETQFEVYSKLDALKNSDWAQIFEYAQKKKITCFSTPFDKDSSDLLYSLDVPAFKIASCDITNLPLIKHIAKKKLPIFISCGMANDEEIKEAVSAIEDTGNQDIIIMHCMTSYPTKYEDANLEMIVTLQHRFPNHVIGYSDHTLGITVPVYSTFYGSKVIEKHFTYDNNLEGSPDHRLSLNAQTFSELVKNLRIAEISRGQPTRTSFDCESKAVKYARRSIVSTVRIHKGTKITKEMLDIKRPATGIYPKFLDEVIGSTAISDIEEDVPIQWEYISKHT